jgi:hypothetical protein
LLLRECDEKWGGQEAEDLLAGGLLRKEGANDFSFIAAFLLKMCRFELLTVRGIGLCPV